MFFVCFVAFHYFAFQLMAMCEANRWRKGQKDAGHHVVAEKPQSIDKESSQLSRRVGQSGTVYEHDVGYVPTM